MRQSHLFFVSAVVILFLAGHGRAQTALILQEKVSVSQKLAGHVSAGLANAPVKGVKVEIFSPDWRKSIKSTTTDESGFFSMEKPAGEKLIYLQLSAPGINPYRLRVHIQKHGPRDLTVHLTIAT